MSVLLEAVHEARELRDLARRELGRAIVRASEQHSLREIGRAAGMSHNAIVYWIKRAREENAR